MAPPIFIYIYFVVYASRFCLHDLHDVYDLYDLFRGAINVAKEEVLLFIHNDCFCCVLFISVRYRFLRELYFIFTMCIVC